MRPVVVCRMKPYIQPFERALAIAELGALAQAEPVPVDQSTSQPMLFSVPSRCEGRLAGPSARLLGGYRGR